MEFSRVVLASLALSVFVLAGAVEPAAAQDPAGDHAVRGQLAASVNNAGLQQSVEWSWRRPLFSSTHALLAEAHVSAGASAAITPASLRGGIWVEIAPVSFFVLRAGFDPSHYFGTFDAITSFDRRDAAFDDDSRKARASARAGRTLKYFLSPTLRARAGHVAGQVSLDVERWSSSAAGPYFYEPTRDTLLAAAGDRALSASTVLLYEHSLDGGGSLSVGPVHSLMRVHGVSLNQVQRVGAIGIHQARATHFGLVAPRTTVVVTRYLNDASKRGQWSAAVAVGFSIGRR